ncbi:hypothetical protein TNCV_4742351 [Trichonephila clavipes]|nr:hypothetical protein TNCV_4742351 [Trichonephila clavipes]
MVQYGWEEDCKPQRSLGVATEHQTWLLEEVELRIYLFLTTSYMANGSNSSTASRQRRTGSSCNCETQDSVLKRPVHKLPIYPN